MRTRTLASMGTLALALVMATAPGCALLAGGGVTSAVPTGRGLGGSVRVIGWTEAFDPIDHHWSEPTPFVGVTTGGDVGAFGWRYFLEANLGIMVPVGDVAILHARVGLAPVAVGHRRTDPDPDAWFGFATSATAGMLFGSDHGGIAVGFEGSVAQDVAYAVPGSGTYVSALLTFGFHLANDLGSH